jgi:hypothetical protein
MKIFVTVGNVMTGEDVWIHIQNNLGFKEKFWELMPIELKHNAIVLYLHNKGLIRSTLPGKYEFHFDNEVYDDDYECMTDEGHDDE